MCIRDRDRLLLREDQFFGRPACHRSTNEAFHELASYPFASRRQCKGRFQHFRRLSVRKGSPTSHPEEVASRTPSSRSIRRMASSGAALARRVVLTSTS